ncbi:glycosyl hydrolase family 32 [Nocardioides mangrovicus]|uniref:Glycosyl hydrolase family 32 n=1 Tax=Nocardioides mangrovicus TaxID=2478913 RepID=A0A3L8P771_9ACTN|nr:glycosyl hydrolase family 32 [Nocardioides mangrovicus]RLV50782.1 glycosyl hydrolase family 32 [Nocardioides mangrovicus]
MFDLPDQYVWDFWLARDEATWHLFHLQAPRSLGDPELRHTHATVGHAVSSDLVSWRSLGQVLPAGWSGSGYDLAVWTGSVVRHDGRWWTFHSGLSRAEAGLRQRVALACSDDLVAWVPTGWTLQADPRWYETLEDGTWPDEHWRDPWVVADDEGLWHMYVTARARGTAPGRGVVGHATSSDLRHWRVEPPLSEPSGLFEQLEVMQLACVAGRWVMVFSCLAGEIVGAAPGDGGCWYVEVEGPGARVDLAGARRLLDERYYVAKLVPTSSDGWGVMAFRNAGDDGCFVGGIVAPMAVAWDGDGHLSVTGC